MLTAFAGLELEALLCSCCQRYFFVVIAVARTAFFVWTFGFNPLFLYIFFILTDPLLAACHFHFLDVGQFLCGCMLAKLVLVVYIATFSEEGGFDCEHFLSHIIT